MSSHDVRLIWLEISTGFLLPFPSCDFIFQTSSRKYPRKWKGMAGMERDYLCERNVNRVFFVCYVVVFQNKNMCSSQAALEFCLLHASIRHLNTR